MRARVILVVAFLLSVSLWQTAHAQGAMTVGAVQAALSEAIASMRDALNEATNDAKSVGNSYQANAQNVIKDLDKMLGDKLSYTFDRLDDQQRALVQNAERLVSLTRDATEQLTSKNFERARILMIEGDIVAYNTTYSLPCRTTRPRIVLVDPVTVSADSEAPIVRVKGNFLLQGKVVDVQIDNHPAVIVQRTDTEIAFKVPENLLNKAKSKQVSVSAKISGLLTMERKIRFILGCSEKAKKLDSDPLVQFLVDPPVSYRVAGTLITTHMVEHVVKDQDGKFGRTGSDHCDDTFAVDQNYCLAGDGTFAKIDITNQSLNCGSAIGPINPSGSRCVFVGGQVRGCGAIRGPFRTWVGCKGRGWVNYDYTLWRKVRERVEAGRSEVAKEGIVGESVFTFAFPGAVDEPNYSFQIVIDKLRGERVLERRSLSSAAYTSGSWQAAVKDGTVTISVQ